MELDVRRGLLIDTNLLVLLVIGLVNPARIATHDRTSVYTAADYTLLFNFAARYQRLYTLPHVLAEVSNLAVIKGQESSASRAYLKALIEDLFEELKPSHEAAAERAYAWLGLVDAAIISVARQYQCNVITADVALFNALQREGIPVITFMQLRRQQVP